MRVGIALLATLASVQAFAQTPPIQPKTPDVKIPAPLILPAPNEIAAGKQPLSADEAVAIAIKNQPQLGIAQGNVLSASGRTQQATSNLLPNFSANGSFTRTQVWRGSGGGSGSGNLFTAGVGVDQLLFDFGRTRDTVRQEQALERATRHNLTRTQQLVALDVRQSFYNYVQDLANVTISEANVANRQRQLSEAQARLDAGLGAPGDVVSAKTSLASAAGALSTARDTAISSQVQLNQSMGVDPRTPIVPATSSESTIENESDLQRLVETALNNRPDIKAAQEQVSAARYAISSAQKGNLPRITASAGANTRGPNDVFGNQTGTFSINVTWDFFDGGFTAGAVKVAKGDEMAARATLIQTTQQVLADVSQAYVDLQSAVQRIDLANVEVANATEFVRIAEGRYTGGIGLFQDVTTAQAALVTAQRDVSQAQQDIQRVRARLKAAIGLA